MAALTLLAGAAVGYYFYTADRGPGLALRESGLIPASPSATKPSTPQGCPVTLDTVSHGASTTVDVSLKGEWVAELKQKFAKIRVEIPELEFDRTVWRTSWPALGRKVLAGNRTTKIENCTVVVTGFGLNEQSTILYGQAR